MNNLRLPVLNLIMDKNIALSSGSSIDSSFPLSNLQNVLPSRVVKFNENIEAEIIFDISSIDSGYRNVTDIFLWGINLASNAVVTIQANASNSWGSPSFTQTLTGIPLDKDYDPSAIPSYVGGMQDDNRTIDRVYIHLNSDIGSYDFIRLLISVTIPSNPENFIISKIFLGTTLQFSINYLEGWNQGFLDTSEYFSYQDGNLASIPREIVDNIKFTLENQSFTDARIVRHMNYSFGKQYTFMFMEPENVNDWDEIRKHTLSYYGQLQIIEVKGDAPNDITYSGTFIAASNGLVEVTPTAIAEEVVELFTIIYNGGAGQGIDSGEDLEWDNDYSDTDDIHNESANKNEINFDKSGLTFYSFGALLSQKTGEGYRKLSAQLNSTEITQSHVNNGSTGGATPPGTFSYLTGYDEMYFIAGDQLTVHFTSADVSPFTAIFVGNYNILGLVQYVF